MRRSAAPTGSTSQFGRGQATATDDAAVPAVVVDEVAPCSARRRLAARDAADVGDDSARRTAASPSATATPSAAAAAAGSAPPASKRLPQPPSVSQTSGCLRAITAMIVSRQGSGTDRTLAPRGPRLRAGAAAPSGRCGPNRVATDQAPVRGRRSGRRCRGSSGPRDRRGWRVVVGSEVPRRSAGCRVRDLQPFVSPLADGRQPGTGHDLMRLRTQVRRSAVGNSGTCEPHGRLECTSINARRCHESSAVTAAQPGVRQTARGRSRARPPARRPRRVGVVEPERRPAGGGQPEMRHQRLGAVVPGPHRHALAVDHRRDVVRMRRPLQREGEDRPLARAPCPARSASSAPEAARWRSRAASARARRCSPSRAPSCTRAPPRARWSATIAGRARLELQRRVGVADRVLAAPRGSCRRRRGTAASPASRSRRA